MKKSYDIGKSLKEAYWALEQAKNVIITTHVNPDGDALGSSLALWHYCREKGKKANIICTNNLPYNLKFMAGADQIRRFDPAKDFELFLMADTVFVLDLNDATRLRDLESYVVNSNARKIVVDHHPEPKKFADIYAVDIESASAGELVYRLIKHDKDYAVSKPVAESLYVAIMTDTGCFRFPRTVPETHRAIAELLECGADPVELYDKVYNTMPLNAVKLLAEAMRSMEVFCNGRLCVMVVPEEFFINTQTSEEVVENFVEKTLAIDGVEVGVLLVDQPIRNEMRISLRSKGDFSVKELAAKFNGGGHINASGARAMRQNIYELRRRIVDEAGQIFARRDGRKLCV